MTRMAGKSLLVLLVALVLSAGVLSTPASAGLVVPTGSFGGPESPRTNEALRLTITEVLPFGAEPGATTCAADVSLSFFSKGGGAQAMEGRATLTALCDDPAYTMIDAAGTFDGKTFTLKQGGAYSWTGTFDGTTATVVGGVPPHTFVFTVPGAARDTTGPVVKALASSAIVRNGQKVPGRFTVTDDSGKARWFVTLYSGGDKVGKGASRGLQPAKGSPVEGAWKGKGIGPFYFCVWAVDATGNKSEDAPMSSCAWISRQVPIPSVSNGCGTSEYGETVASILNWFGDTQEYGDVTVNNRLLCNQHDAAYAGVTVGSTTTHTIVDYRLTTRLRADDELLFGIRAQCQRKLSKSPDLLAQCESDAGKYYALVRNLGVGAYDADATTPGVQTAMPTNTTPAGGARDNR
jgi:hypothetical protein